MSWLSRGERTRWSPAGLFRFVPYFIRTTIHGGVDVSRRALSPRMRLEPGLLRYDLRLVTGTARVFFVNSVSLLPGTLSADLRGDCLWVHVIDLSQANHEQLRRLEERVAGLFALGPIGKPMDTV
jgi:multicomponent Na+:H+ antiporter subunit E